MQAGLVGSVVAIMFISCEQQKLLWFLLFLTPCLESLAQTANTENPVPMQPVIAPSDENDVYDFEGEELEFT
jgi:hypothetical protein